jgi:ankyrin repeat protein
MKLIDPNNYLSFNTLKCRFFPAEILWKIFQELPYPDLYTICQMDEYRDLCSNPGFWRDKLNHDFNVTTDPGESLSVLKLRYVRFYTQQIGYTYGSEQFEPLKECLREAVMKDNYPLVRYYLLISGDIITALSLAVMNNNFKMVKYLYLGSNRFWLGLSVCSAINEAITHHYNDIATWLLARSQKDLYDSDPEFVEEVVNPALATSIQSSNREMISKLRQAGANANIGLIEAIRSQNYALVNAFIADGATNFNTALIEAAKVGNLRLTIKLITLGATHIPEAFHQAIYHKHRNLASYLIQYYAKEIRDQSTPSDLNSELRLAARDDNLELVKQLLHLGADDLDGAYYEARSNWNPTGVEDYLKTRIYENKYREFQSSHW